MKISILPSGEIYVPANGVRALVHDPAVAGVRRYVLLKGFAEKFEISEEEYSRIRDQLRRKFAI